MNYRVIWEIDAEANTPQEAAVQAMNYQHNYTTANVFTVRDENGITRTVDLGDVPRSMIQGYKHRGGRHAE